MERKPILPKYVRLFTYSYLPTNELLFKIALLSSIERSAIPDSELIGQRNLNLVLKGMCKNESNGAYLI